MIARVVVLSCLSAGVVSVVAQTPSPFRAGTTAVTVSVSVKNGNNAVVGLTAGDFALLDNGVRQSVQVISLEAVPIDVTLFMDTSGSTAGALDQMKDSVRQIAAMLKPADRFRLLTIGNSVYQPIPWTDAGRALVVDIAVIGGISLVHDAIAAALIEPVAVGRRHLVVALTDGRDCGSVTSPAMLRELAGRSEAVVHWVPMAGAATSGGRAVCDAYAPFDDTTVKDVAARTGGETHPGFGNAVKAFTKVFEDFRQGYVLGYTPAGVAPPGWHAIVVQVPAGHYAIHARPGYFGS